MEKVLEIIGETVLFLIACYFIFFKKYLEELGKQTAELTTIKEKTLEIESAKKTFNEDLEQFKKDLQVQISGEIEPLKSALSRKNMEFQIYQSEFVRLRFERLDELYSILYELQKYCKTNLFFYADTEDFNQKKEKFHEYYERAEDALYKANLYIDDSISASAIDLLNKCFESLRAFSTFYNSDPQKYQKLFQYQDQQLIQKVLDRNENSLQQLHDSINKFPELLRNIEFEFKKNMRLDADENSDG